MWKYNVCQNGEVFSKTIGIISEKTILIKEFRFFLSIFNNRILRAHIDDIIFIES